MHLYSLDLPNETATQALGVALAPLIEPGFVIHLKGDLGVGKTTLTRALLRSLGVRGALRSPSYALLEPYELPQLGGATLHHFDFYRLEATPFAWKDAGFQAAFEAPNAAIVEWPEHAQGLPLPNLHVELAYEGNARIALLKINDPNAALVKVVHQIGAIAKP